MFGNRSDHRCNSLGVGRKVASNVCLVALRKASRKPQKTSVKKFWRRMKVYVIHMHAMIIHIGN